MRVILPAFLLGRCFFCFNTKKGGYIMIDSVTLKQLAEQQRRDYYKKYRELNNEKLKKYRKQWRLNNKEKIKQYNDDYWEKKALAAIEAEQRGEV